MAAAPAMPCPIDPYTPQVFLDMFDRLLPPHYLEPLKDPGPGYEMLRAFAAAMSRLSLAVARVGCGAYILSSTGGAAATGEVEFYRATPNAEGIDVTVKAGTVVTCSLSGRRFQTTADVFFAIADLGPFTVGVVAELEGYEFNVTGRVVAADGNALAGEIDTIDTLVEDPDMGDLTIAVRMTSTSASGGVDASLDQNGLDRGITRLLSETDDAYRARVRSLPDNISPASIERAVRLFLYPLNASGDFIETWDIAYQTCWDGPPDPIAGSNYDPSLCVYDDPDADSVPFRNRWLDENDHRGGFIIQVPNLAPMRDTSLVWNEVPANPVDSNPGDYTNALGGRACCAYDVPATLAFGYIQGGYDGFDLPKQAVYKGLWDTLQSIKAAGISAAIELRGE